MMYVLILALVLFRLTIAAPTGKTLDTFGAVRDVAESNISPVPSSPDIEGNVWQNKILNCEGYEETEKRRNGP